MRQRFVHTLFPVLAACAAAPSDPTRTPDPTPTATAPATGPATGPAPQRPEAVPTGGPGASAPAIWRDPDFKRRFAESFIAETEIEPRIDVDEIDLLDRVRVHMGENELAGAVKLLQASRGRTTSAAIDCALGNLLFQQEQVDKAKEAYLTAIEKHPKFRRAWVYLGQIYYREKDTANAIRAFSEVIKLGGRDALTYGLLGVLHLGRKDSVAAESAFRVATMLQPEDSKWKMGLAESFFKQGRYADAVAHFGKMIEAEPDRADLWLAQGEAYALMKKPLSAAQSYEIADRLGAASLRSLNNLGDIYANEGLHDLAVGAFARALAKEPKAPPDRAIRAARFLNQRGARDATERLVDAIEKAYGDELGREHRMTLLRLRSRIALARGASDEEAKILKQIVDLDPLDGDALILLGQHSARNGDADQAIHYYERAAAIERFQADAKVRHAQLLVGNGNYAAALRLLRRAQEIQYRENVQDFLERVERAAKNH